MFYHWIHFSNEEQARAAETWIKEHLGLAHTITFKRGNHKTCYLDFKTHLRLDSDQIETIVGHTGCNNYWFNAE